jgi:hypothetical protein
MAVKDGRLPPFLWIANDAMDELRRVPPRDRLGAMGVYACLAYMASTYRDGGHDGFSATRRELATVAGIGVRTVDRYVAILEKVALLQVERGHGAANIWMLSNMPTSPERGVSKNGTTQTGEGSKNDTGGSVEKRHPHVTKNELQEKRQLGLGAEVVRAREALGPSVLAEFNKRSGRVWSNGSLAAIRERLDENPELTLADHVKILDAAFADPWWEEVMPPPRVVYGSAELFERRIAEASGKRRSRNEHPADRRHRELVALKERLQAEGR